MDGLGDTLDPASFRLPTLRDAARRFGVERPTTLRKAELIEALEYTAWTPEADNVHTCIREFRPERGQPENYRGRPVLQKPFAKDDLERVLKTLSP